VIIWTDTETTGLDPDEGLLLEVALLATTDTLVPADEGITVVLAVDEQEARSRMTEHVLNMHASSGLLDAVRDSTTPPEVAEDYLAAYLGRHATLGAPLAGNNVKFDRRWLERHMPSVIERVHYRDICVSSLKETVRRFWPQAYESRPVKKFEHRAMDDVHESLGEYRHYLAALGAAQLRESA